MSVVGRPDRTKFRNQVLASLPEKSYSEEEVTEKAEDVYRHIYRAYPTLPSPFYASV